MKDPYCYRKVGNNDNNEGNRLIKYASTKAVKLIPQDEVAA